MRRHRSACTSGIWPVVLWTMGFLGGSPGRRPKIFSSWQQTRDSSTRYQTGSRTRTRSAIAAGVPASSSRYTTCCNKKKATTFRIIVLRSLRPRARRADSAWSVVLSGHSRSLIMLRSETNCVKPQPSMWIDVLAAVCVHKCPTRSLIPEHREEICHPPEDGRERMRLRVSDHEHARADGPGAG